MQGDDPREGDPAAELERLAEDWIALWQSEIAGLAADREMAEGWAAMGAAWAALGAAWLRAAAAPPFGRAPPGFPPGAPPGYPPGAPPGFAYAMQSPWWPPADDRPAAPPRAPAAAAAPDPGGEPGDGGDRQRGDATLARRVAELEQRLAGLERGGAPDLPGGAGGSAPDRRRPRRRKPAG
ncbi:hypothetical protein [Falsiroseomonas selenitidurans]|uniref:hypothetical protein n=1 Tax=Falsiroseomonas selenitidurans TaxID=2716335 RepID=UPI001F37BA02|nr:hypothetical protein [Falsiroseomonas selenitidurans]